MTLRPPGFSSLLVKSASHERIKEEAMAKGMKVWAVAELAFNDYFRKNGETD